VIDSVYFKQAELLLRIIPLIDREAVFALKGGTAINFFARDIPRISVDAAMRKAFVVYLISHHRPMIEVLNPGFLYIRSVFKTEFRGMTLEASHAKTWKRPEQLAAFPKKNSHFEFWLPLMDALRNNFAGPSKEMINTILVAQTQVNDGFLAIRQW